MVIEKKNFITNFSALVFVVISYYLPDGVGKQMLASASIFALAGAVTNWLAIYMLFEKIPFLYGSGVIPTQFKAFKLGIERLIMGQFFTQNNVSKFLESDKISGDKLWESISNKIDYDSIFQALKSSVVSSSFGGMLAMFGGEEVIDKLKPSMIDKLKLEFEKMVVGMELSLTSKSDHVEDIVNKIHNIVQSRLDELTPDMVKNIIQDMIRKHLGWLVVWGGVFGAILGIVAEILNIV